MSQRLKHKKTKRGDRPRALASNVQYGAVPYVPNFKKLLDASRSNWSSIPKLTNGVDETLSREKQQQQFNKKR